MFADKMICYTRLLQLLRKYFTLERIFWQIISYILIEIIGACLKPTSIEKDEHCTFYMIAIALVK